MALPEPLIRSILEQLANRPDLFEDLVRIPFVPPLSAPSPRELLRGRLDRGTLVIDAPLGAEHFTLDRVEDEGNYFDPGSVLPNGAYFIYQEPILADGYFPIFRLEARAGTIRFQPISLRVTIADSNGADFLGRLAGRGLLFYNDTEKPRPLFDFLTYDIEEWKNYEILFIDLCANFARNRLAQSRSALGVIAESARSQDALFQLLAQQLRSKANLYHRLEELRDLFNLLSYLRFLHLAGSFSFSPAAEDLGVYRRLAEVVIPEMEARLREHGHALQLDQLVEQIDQTLRELRRGAPLLGRLRWDEIRGASDADLAARVERVVTELSAANERSRRMLEEDMESIRRALRLVPPRVMGVPRIVGAVEQLYQSEIQSRAAYFWAVQRLKSHASGFSMMLGLGSVFFSFFCPPVGIAFGIFSAAVSVDEAIFHTALSDSDVDVDATFVTQAEAREKRIWAAVDVIFAMVDLAGGIAAARRALRGANLADDLAAAPRSLDELAQLGAEGSHDVRSMQRLAEAAEPEAIARATSEIDLRAARGELAEDLGRIDLSRSRQLENPSSARQAIEEASPVVRQGIEPDLLPLVDRAYAQHFDEVRELGKNPLTWDAFASDWYRARLAEVPVPRIEAPPRSLFYQSLLEPTESLAELLGSPGTLRQRLVDRLAAGSLPPNLSDFDRAFLARLRSELPGALGPGKLDEIIQTHFLGPLDEIAARAGYAAGEGRDFGLFAAGIRNLGSWDDSAFPALRRLLADPAIESAALHRMMNNAGYTRHASTPRLNMELAIALDRIRGVEGVLNRVSGTNPPLIQSLVSGNRGHAFEAILVSRLLDEAGAQGARITVGRRWWLQSIERMNALEGTRFTNVLEADILVTLPEGRRILIDGKFYTKGVAIDSVLASQMAKMADGIEEGLIHNAEFWVSHHFVASREGLSNLEAFQITADLFSHGRIHLVYDIFENGIPGDFFRRSRFLEVSRGEAVLLPPPATGIRLPGVSGPFPIPSTPASPPRHAVLPVTETIGQLQPALTQSEIIRTSSSIARDLRQSYIPIHPLSSGGRLTVQLARLDAAAAQQIGAFVLLHAPGDASIGGTPARELANGMALAAVRERIRDALGSPPPPGGAIFQTTNRIAPDTAPESLFALAFHCGAPVTPGTRFQLVLYQQNGDRVRVHPNETGGEPLLQGWNVLPLLRIPSGSGSLFPVLPGSYSWVLQFEQQGRFVTHPHPVAMRVERAPGGGG